MEHGLSCRDDFLWCLSRETATSLVQFSGRWYDLDMVTSVMGSTLLRVSRREHRKRIPEQIFLMFLIGAAMWPGGSNPGRDPIHQHDFVSKSFLMIVEKPIQKKVTNHTRN